MKWNEIKKKIKTAEREHNIVEQIKTNEMKINKAKQKKRKNETK